MDENRTLQGFIESKYISNYKVIAKLQAENFFLYLESANKGA